MTMFNYQFKKLIRSYTYIPPYALFIVWIILLYVYSGQPVLSAYASATIILLPVAAWLTINNFKLESNTERQLLFIQNQSKLKYLTNKLIFSFIIMIPLILFSIIYPIILHSFSEHLTISKLFLGLYLHILVIIIGMIIGAVIKTQNILSKRYSWLLLILIVLLSILRHTVIQHYPISKFVLWIIPPIGDVIKYYQLSLTKILSTDFLLLNIWFVLYIILSSTLLYYIFSKTEYL